MSTIRKIAIYRGMNEFSEETKSYEPVWKFIGKIEFGETIALSGSYKFRVIDYGFPDCDRCTEKQWCGFCIAKALEEEEG